MSTRKETILIALVSGIVIAVLAFFLIFFLGQRIKEKSEEVIEARRELILSRGETGSVAGIKSSFSEIKPDLERIENLFVDSEAPVEFIEFLEKTAARSEVSFEINPAGLKEEKEAIWEGIGFQIKAVGSSDGSLRFLDKLESSPYLTEIQNISISKLKEESLKSEKYEGFSSGDLILDIKLKAFAK